jgi:hypothetical protein
MHSKNSAMKKNLLLTFVFAAVGMITYAQSLNFEADDGTVLNSQERVINGSNAPGYITQAIMIRNVSAGTIDARVKRYELNVQPLTQNYFCWGLCFAEMDAGDYPVFPVIGGADNFPLGPNESGQLDVYHRPEGLMGSSTYRYVVFDQMNPNDSSWFDVTFTIWGVSVTENQSPEFSFYPNPAAENMFIQLKNSTSEMNIEVIDLLGKTVKSQVISASQQISVNVSDLNAGVYFVRLSDKKKVYSTKKLVVRH